MFSISFPRLKRHDRTKAMIVILLIRTHKNQIEDELLNEIIVLVFAMNIGAQL